MMLRDLSEKETWEILKPVCRELYELFDEKHIEFINGKHNENNGTYRVELKCKKMHFASRGIRDSIADIEYNRRKIRIGLRANGIPVNIFVDPV